MVTIIDQNVTNFTSLYYKIALIKENLHYCFVSVLLSVVDITRVA